MMPDPALESPAERQSRIYLAREERRQAQERSEADARRADEEAQRQREETMRFERVTQLELDSWERYDEKVEDRAILLKTKEDSMRRELERKIAGMRRRNDEEVQQMRRQQVRYVQALSVESVDGQFPPLPAEPDRGWLESPATRLPVPLLETQRTETSIDTPQDSGGQPVSSAPPATAEQELGRPQANAETAGVPRLSNLLISSPRQEPVQLEAKRTNGGVDSEDEPLISSFRRPSKRRRINTRSEPGPEQETVADPIYHTDSEPEPGSGSDYVAALAGGSVRRRRRSNLSPTTEIDKVDWSAEDKHIQYDEVFNNGDPKFAIVTWPRRSNAVMWYILQCRDCNVQFTTKGALKGAGCHLGSNYHRNGRRDADWCISVLGERVEGCDADKAKRNNEVLYTKQCTTQRKPALQSESGGRNTTTEPRPASATKLKPRLLVTVPYPALLAKKSRGACLDAPVKVSDGYWLPPFGEICAAAKPNSKGDGRALEWCAAVRLPPGVFDKTLGLSGSFGITPLAAKVPSCYQDNKYGPAAEFNWAPSYKAHSKSVTKRRFPMLFLDVDLPLPLRNGLGAPLPPFPAINTMAWVAAGRLGLLDLSSAPGGIQGLDMARRFRAYMVARKLLPDRPLPMTANEAAVCLQSTAATDSSPPQVSGSPASSDTDTVEESTIVARTSVSYVKTGSAINDNEMTDIEDATDDYDAAARHGDAADVPDDCYTPGDARASPSRSMRGDSYQPAWVDGEGYANDFEEDVDHGRWDGADDAVSLVGPHEAAVNAGHSEVDHVSSRHRAAANLSHLSGGGNTAASVSRAESNVTPGLDRVDLKIQQARQRLLHGQRRSLGNAASLSTCASPAVTKAETSFGTAAAVAPVARTPPSSSSHVRNINLAYSPAAGADGLAGGGGLEHLQEQRQPPLYLSVDLYQTAAAALPHITPRTFSSLPTSSIERHWTELMSGLSSHGSASLEHDYVLNHRHSHRHTSHNNGVSANVDSSFVSSGGTGGRSKYPHDPHGFAARHDVTTHASPAQEASPQIFVERDSSFCPQHSGADGNV